MDFAKTSSLNWIRLNHSFRNINILDHYVQMKILSRNLSFAVDLDKQSDVQIKMLSRNLSCAVDLDKQNFCIKVDQSNETKICEISVFTDFFILIISNVDFIKNFPTEVNQSKPKCLKCELCHYIYKC